MADTPLALLRPAVLALVLSLVPCIAVAAASPAGVTGKTAQQAPAAKAKKAPQTGATASKSAPADDAAAISDKKVDQELDHLEKNMRGPSNLRGKDGRMHFEPGAKQPRHGDGTTPDTPKEKL